MTASYDAVLFDLDGVLTSTAALHASCWKSVFDQALADWNAREIRCHGEMFDPRRMNAIDREPSSDLPAGTVIEVYRSGYEWNGEVFRPAQVKVACARTAGKDHE